MRVQFNLILFLISVEPRITTLNPLKQKKNQISIFSISPFALKFHFLNLKPKLNPTVSVAATDNFCVRITLLNQQKKKMKLD